MISIYYQRSEEMLHWKARESYQSLSREEKTKSTSIHATNMGSFLWKLDLMKKKKTKNLTMHVNYIITFLKEKSQKVWKI